MKMFSLSWQGCGEEDLEFIEITTTIMKIQDTKNYLLDYATGCRILSSIDTLLLIVTPEQELAIKLRYGDRLVEVDI